MITLLVAKEALIQKADPDLEDIRWTSQFGRYADVVIAETMHGVKILKDREYDMLKDTYGVLIDTVVVLKPNADSGPELRYTQTSSHDDQKKIEAMISVCKSLSPE